MTAKTIFVTGSSQGIGLNAARDLMADGHAVILHARNSDRAAAINQADAAGIVTGDLSTIAGMRSVADQAAAAGPVDAVIHNAALGYRESRRVETEDGLSQLWAVNVLAPYVLTCLIPPPARLIYTGSGMHLGASADLGDLQWRDRRWQGAAAYAETKLHDLLLANAIARAWPDIAVNTVSPGWVPTRMGGAGAPDDLGQAHLTQVWLAASDDPMAMETGRFLYHKRPAETHPAADDVALQDALLAACAAASGLTLPGSVGQD